MNRNITRSPIDNKSAATAKTKALCLIHIYSNINRRKFLRWLDKNDPGITSFLANSWKDVEVMNRSLNPDFIFIETSGMEEEVKHVVEQRGQENPNATIILLSSNDYDQKPHDYINSKQIISLNFPALDAEFSTTQFAKKLSQIFSKSNEVHTVVTGLKFKSHGTHSSQVNFSGKFYIDSQQKKYPLRAMPNLKPRALLFGCSTGGPAALLRVLADLEDIRRKVPIFIIQHMQAGFTPIFADNIARLTGQKTHVVKEGMKISTGEIYIAPCGHHLLLERKGASILTKLDHGPEVHYCRPAVDPTFASAAQVYGPGVMGVILTGLGSDGGDGAMAIAKMNGIILAQDEETSVVWGMPKSAAQKEACNLILPLRKIGPAICDIINGKNLIGKKR